MVALAHTEASASHQPFSGTELYESKYQVQSFSSIMVYYSGFCLSAAYFADGDLCRVYFNSALSCFARYIFGRPGACWIFSRCNISAFPLINPWQTITVRRSREGLRIIGNSPKTPEEGVTCLVCGSVLAFLFNELCKTHQCQGND